MTGESIDEPMEEVMRKLEEGISPDQIEDSMADVLEDSEDGAEKVDNKEMIKKKIFKRKSFRFCFLTVDPLGCPWPFWRICGFTTYQLGKLPCLTS